MKWDVFGGLWVEKWYKIRILIGSMILVVVSGIVRVKIRRRFVIKK